MLLVGAEGPRPLQESCAAQTGSDHIRGHFGQTTKVRSETIASSPGWIPFLSMPVVMDSVVCVCVCVSQSVVSDVLQPRGLEPARLLCPWNSPGKNPGVGCHYLLQGNCPDPRIEPGSPVLQADSLLSEPPGSDIPSKFIYWSSSLQWDSVRQWGSLRRELT